MSISGRIFAAVYDRSLARVEKAGLAARRAELLASARGQVLEIGAGTGANLAFYGPAVESLVLTEPEAPMVKRLSKRVLANAPSAKVLHAPAEDLPFDGGSFDTVVSTLVLCTVADLPRALREVRRVLRADGQLLFIEHVQADDARLARTQDRVNGLNRVVAHGCNCNRPTLRCLQEAGFDIVTVEHASLDKAPPFVRPLIVGAATPTGVVRASAMSVAEMDAS